MTNTPSFACSNPNLKHLSDHRRVSLSDRRSNISVSTLQESYRSMDNMVDSLSSTYEDFVAAAATFLEAAETSDAPKNPAAETALQNFKLKWELFKVACDQAEEFVFSVKKRRRSESFLHSHTKVNI